MPRLLNRALYDIVYSVSKQVFTSNQNLVKRYKVVYGVGTPLFRYVGYRDSKPQEDSSARKIWNTLEYDTENRWTGMGTDGKGTSGLYLSMEESRDSNTRFPELEHYQNPQESSQVLQYMEYNPGRPPEWKDVNGHALRSVFLFTLHSKIKGIDLRLPNDLIDAIFIEAQREIFDLLGPTASVDSLYYNPDDASFNRAVGNAAFDTIKNCDFLITTSVRDKKSINVVMRGNPGVAMDQLKAEGRITFLRDDELRAVYTKDDLIYNGKLEQADELAKKGGFSENT